MASHGHACVPIPVCTRQWMFDFVIPGGGTGLPLLHGRLPENENGSQSLIANRLADRART
jgi:hypothetical protein